MLCVPSRERNAELQRVSSVSLHGHSPSRITSDTTGTHSKNVWLIWSGFLPKGISYSLPTHKPCFQRTKKNTTHCWRSSTTPAKLGAKAKRPKVGAPHSM